MAAVAAPASIPQQTEETRQRPLILAQVIPSSHLSLEGGRSVCSIRSWASHAPHAWHHVSAQHVCHLQTSPQSSLSAASRCMLQMPLAISIGKLLYLQETAVTKPHRIKTCDKKEETQKNVHTLQGQAAPPTCSKTMLDMFMHKEINFQGASNSVMQSRGKLKHYLDFWPNFQD
jgi:hypothetical protein